MLSQMHIKDILIGTKFTFNPLCKNSIIQMNRMINFTSHVNFIWFYESSHNGFLQIGFEKNFFQSANLNLSQFSSQTFN